MKIEVILPPNLWKHATVGRFSDCDSPPPIFPFFIHFFDSYSNTFALARYPREEWVPIYENFKVWVRVNRLYNTLYHQRIFLSPRVRW